MTLVARLIAKQEGFGIPGTLPTRNHNPGDLRHSPHSTHTADNPNGIGIIDTDAHGWADLEHQLQLYAQRGMTLRQVIYIYAPPNENDTARYLEFVCVGLGCEPDILMADALKIGDVDQLRA